LFKKHAEGLDLVEAEPLAESVERFGYAPAGAHLTAQESEVRGKFWCAASKLLPNPDKSRIEAQSCIDANKQKINKVRKSDAVAFEHSCLPALNISCRPTISDVGKEPRQRQAQGQRPLARQINRKDA